MRDTEHLYPLAIVKGIIEHGDGTKYFGSLMSYNSWVIRAVDLGLILDDRMVTEKGARIYDKYLVTLPQDRRASAWGSDYDDILTLATQAAREA